MTFQGELMILEFCVGSRGRAELMGREGRIGRAQMFVLFGSGQAVNLPGSGAGLVGRGELIRETTGGSLVLLLICFLIFSPLLAKLVSN